MFKKKNQLNSLNNEINNEVKTFNKKFGKKVKHKVATKSIAEIQQELFNNGWRNDTLSPLSTKPYWLLADDLIPKKETVLSALFATNSSYAPTKRNFCLILTNKKIYQASNIGDYSKSVKSYSPEKYNGMRLWQDKWLESWIYIDIYFSRLRVWKIETADSTSSIHFKSQVLKQRKKPWKINSNPAKQVDMVALKNELRLDSYKIPGEKRK
ncbi:hypothetical protein [Mesoplasma lactucae]|uniref:Uncharacterized protein n=1 Tax=Mesoplasma lactucae ATCC 49193 TaxID=81460 RepID=A0A291ISL8_9MOLU|nr:hypothetical protein [Mesoplasma lactucae]ATG97718.1 hypothetical protein CP520_03200 [Mesoplasma lactucae ATCC 49193]ATZ20507.1 hypothetical protein MLACT_v1c06860 [Mesoplasma lactucae ATCC 49193]MCL8216678.1 hypothetical protein [Mesoplasma lactucae ATCC 49193]